MTVSDPIADMLRMILRTQAELEQRLERLEGGHGAVSPKTTIDLQNESRTSGKETDNAVQD